MYQELPLVEPTKNSHLMTHTLSQYNCCEAIVECLFSLLDEITASFRRFGHLFVDWPHKAESKSYFPPKGESRDQSALLSATCSIVIKMAYLSLLLKS